MKGDLERDNRMASSLAKYLRHFASGRETKQYTKSHKTPRYVKIVS